MYQQNFDLLRQQELVQYTQFKKEDKDLCQEKDIKGTINKQSKEEDHSTKKPKNFNSEKLLKVIQCIQSRQNIQMLSQEKGIQMLDYTIPSCFLYLDYIDEKSGFAQNDYSGNIIFVAPECSQIQMYQQFYQDQGINVSTKLSLKSQAFSMGKNFTNELSNLAFIQIIRISYL
ncbi:hypothetical protein ABPG73_022678 [Tetrahymena malaccensis]